QVGDLTGLVRLFVGDNLDLLGFLPAILPAAAGYPEPCDSFDLAALRRLGRDLHVEASGLASCKLDGAVAVFAGGSVTRFIHDRRRTVLVTAQLGVKCRLHRIAVIILGGNGELYVLARLVHVFVGSHTDAEAAVGRDNRVESGNLSAALVGDAGLDAIAR